MVSKLDAGDILFQKKFNIENQKTSEIWNDFAQKTAENFPEFLKNYFAQNLLPKKQDEKKATFCHKFKKSDGEIFPKTESAKTIYQKFLAFDVWPQVFLQTKKGKLKLTEISLENASDSVELKSKNQASIFIKKAQLEGKKEMKILEILRGHPDLF